MAQQGAAVLPTIGRLARGAREHGVQVCHLTFCPLAATRSANRKPRLFNSVIPLMAGWRPGDPATQVVDEIGVDADDLVLPRSAGLSPTYGTQSFAILRNLGIRAVVVASVSNNIAIPAVLAQAVDEGFDVLVARDAVVGTPGEYADAMMRYTVGMISELTTVDDLVAQWETSAATSAPPVRGVAASGG